MSMPGMMDTILNVGLDETSEALWRDKLGDHCYVDSLHRLICMYGSVVHDIPRQDLEKDDVLSALNLFQRRTKTPFPMTKQQVLGAIEAVFRSWNNDRAKVYRKMHNIPEDWGTAVVIQAMVFGNMNDSSGTGVLFTRHPDTGENVITGEFLINAQGEDVVAGIRTPMSLAKMAEWNPPVAAQLMKTVEWLETLRKDVQDVEFTIQDGKLYVLQTRNAKRTSRAAIRIALDMAKEGLISAEEALSRVTMKDLDLAAAVIIDPKFKTKEDFVGLPACSGVVSGRPVFSSEDAIKCTEPCILITQETTPDDIAGMAAARGVVTIHGGSTSHAAVVARGMNKPCVVGVGGDNTLDIIKKYQKVSIDGATGRIWLFEVPVVDGKANPVVAAFRTFAATTKGIIPLVDGPMPGVQDVLLDLSQELTDPGVLAKLSSVLAAHSTVYVDIRQTVDGHDALLRFNRMFGGLTDCEAEFLNTLSVLMPKEAKNRMRVLTRSKKLYGFQSVAASSELEEIILATGALALSGDMTTPVMKKVLAWKKAEGVEMVVVAAYSPDAKSICSIEQALS